jgi:putative membrane protein
VWVVKNGFVLVLLLILLILLFFSAADHGHMWGWENRMDFAHGGSYMWIILLIIIGVVVYLIIQNTKSKTDSDKETPLDIIKKRFAKGEITKEQYEEIKKKLEE